jgi:hypothetical protein
MIQKQPQRAICDFFVMTTVFSLQKCKVTCILQQNPKLSKKTCHGNDFWLLCSIFGRDKE